jgi:hypothetical protein
MRELTWGLAFLIAACEPPAASDDGGGEVRADAARRDAGSSERRDAGRDRDAYVSRADGGPRTGGRIFLERHYETEDVAELYLDLPIGTMRYVAGGGFAGSNAWELHVQGDAENVEGGIGWHSVDFPEDTTDVMFVGHMLYVSQGMIDRMVEDGAMGKMLDAHMHPFDNIARQTIQWRLWPDEEDRPYGLVPALCAGGAGYGFVRQVGGTMFDLRNYPDQWIWVEMMLDAATGTTTLWIKTADGVFSGEYDAPVITRSAANDDDWGDTEARYQYYEPGWSYVGLLWGYWQRLEGVTFQPEDFVRLDDLIVSDAWIEPPF